MLKEFGKAVGEVLLVALFAFGWHGFSVLVVQHPALSVIPAMLFSYTLYKKQNA